MNYNYLNNSHNKIFKRNKLIYKFFKSKNKYVAERDFYIKTRNKFSFIPKFYGYCDNRFLIIIENAGETIKRKEFLENKETIRILADIIIKESNYYHNDLWYRNVVKKNGYYYIIDWESSSEIIPKNIHKNNKEIFISY